jgi:hypothetical protein
VGGGVLLTKYLTAFQDEVCIRKNFWREALMDSPVSGGYKGGRWALLVFKASPLPLQPPHHHCFFLFYSGLLKFNGGEKVHIRLAWEWVVGGLTASVGWAGGANWRKGPHKVAADTHRMFCTATKDHWLACSGYWSNLRADPKISLLSLHKRRPVRQYWGFQKSVSKVRFTLTLNWCVLNTLFSSTIGIIQSEHKVFPWLRTFITRKLLYVEYKHIYIYI